MISHKHKTIFVHVPKVAGQSIENVFLADLGLNWKSRKPLLLMHNDIVENGPPRLAHLEVEEYVKYHYISKEIFNEYFKFSFVRNPWDRAVSFYKYSFQVKGVDFKTFVKKILTNLVEENHFFYKPQFEYLYVDDKLNVDFVGRFENLNNDFSKVLRMLDLDNLELLHKNKSKIIDNRNRKIKAMFNKLTNNNLNQPVYSSYASYYDQESIDIVSNLYKKDIELFQYSFQN